MQSENLREFGTCRSFHEERHVIDHFLNILIIGCDEVDLVYNA